MRRTEVARVRGPLLCALWAMSAAGPSFAATLCIGLPTWQPAPLPLKPLPSAVTTHRLEVSVLVADGVGGAVVAAGRPGQARTWPHFQRVTASPLGAAGLFGGTPEFPTDVWAGALMRCGIIVATSVGLLVVRGGEIERLELFVGTRGMSGMQPGPATSPVLAGRLATDGLGNLWLVGDRSLSFGGDCGVVFPTDPALWHPASFSWGDPGRYPGALTGALLPLLAAEGEDARYPPLLSWRAPFQAMAGDPRGPGLWVYGFRGAETPDLMHLGPEFPSPFPTADPRSAVPAGVLVPAVADPKLAAGMDGRVWLAGDTLEGSRVYVFDGLRFTEVTPPAEMLRGRRFTQLLAAAGGELYAATDGVGILVLDANGWREHPVNADLPTLEGTAIKPVSCIDLDPNLGYLWVGTDNNVLCWKPD